jgi:hypothetical protein
MRKASDAVSKGVANATEPIRNTEAYKTLAETVLEALDDSGSIKHAGYEEKEARRKRRQMRLAKAGLSGIAKKRTAVNPECVRDQPLSIIFRILIHSISSSEPAKHSFCMRMQKSETSGKP